jgi:hypothetical protein
VRSGTNGGIKRDNTITPGVQTSWYIIPTLKANRLFGAVYSNVALNKVKEEETPSTTAKLAEMLAETP